ncbi:MAG: LamG-like jellyroll fold domain-containing protein [Planctomycetota bacterium]
MDEHQPAGEGSTPFLKREGIAMRTKRLNGSWMGSGVGGLLMVVSLLIGFVLGSPADVAAHEDDVVHHHGQRQATSFYTSRQRPRILPLPKSEDAFQFIVYGDRTGGVPEGLKVLQQAVSDTNLLDPDLVMTVGDLIQGYNEKPEWLLQMKAYRDIMEQLNMSWFPVAGNHDVYWRGKGPAPQGHHESNYEEHFGPLWYTFAHKNAGFIVLYSDEGDPVSNQKAFNVPMLQRMSDEQLAFLDTALKKYRDRDHVFVFLHHPRWIGRGYAGGNWDVVERMLLEAGNVSGIFAGHIHHMRYDESKGNDLAPLRYFTLATTGGSLSADIPGAGYLHHMNLVTVRPSGVTMASLPVGSVMDPSEFTQAFLAQIDLARGIRARLVQREGRSPTTLIQSDGSARGDVALLVRNPCGRPIDGTLSMDAASAGWVSSLDHHHFELGAGEEMQLAVTFTRPLGSLDELTIPKVRLDLVYKGESAAVEIPAAVTSMPLDLAAVPADFFQAGVNRCLNVYSESAATRVDRLRDVLPDGPFTLEAWVRPGINRGQRAIVAKTQGSEYALFSDEGVPQFDVHLDGRYVTAAAEDVMPTDRWTHVAGVFDGQNVSLFVDGHVVASKPGSGERTRNSLPLYIGADPDVAGRATRSFAGRIDEVRLSRGVVYTDSFDPSERLDVTDQTVLMMHLDRRVGPFTLDHSTSAVQKGVIGPTGQLLLRDGDWD